MEEGRLKNTKEGAAGGERAQKKRHVDCSPLIIKVISVSPPLINDIIQIKRLLNSRPLNDSLETIRSSERQLSHCSQHNATRFNRAAQSIQT